MKKLILISSALLILTVMQNGAQAEPRRYEGQGEVLSVDPLFGRVTIKHVAIKGFGGSDETEFFVTSASLIRNIQTRDLVAFTIVEEKGEARIEKIKKTGEVEIKKEKTPLGEAVQGVISATGEAAKVVTRPIEPAHEVVSGTMDATTSATDDALGNQESKVSRNF